MKADVRAVLLDIEGTTTPVDFVYQTLFPFARKHLSEFLIREAAAPDVSADIATLVEEHARDKATDETVPDWTGETTEAATRFALWLMDRDRKSTALKSIQGKIWEAGYKSGELRGVVYDDVPRAFSRWRDEEKVIAIYSSGSVLAQRLIFEHTNVGDLTGMISAYFDTTTGPKKESGSYLSIASALGVEPCEVIFYSDSLAEVDAARVAGMKTALCVREGEAPMSVDHRVIRNFDEE